MKTRTRWCKTRRTIPNPQSPIPNPHSTEAGTVMGTAGYMSPEQARGQRMDARTDLFSLGVVLYEMLAGKRPFAGVNMIDVLGAIMHETPAPLPEAPAELQRIVTKALHKDREARYQSIKEFQLELKNLQRELEFAAEAHRRAELVPSSRAALGAQASRLRSERSDATASDLSASAEAEAIPSREKRAALHALAAGETPALPGAPRFAGKRAALAISLLALVLVAAAAYFFLTRKAAPALAEREPILLADFENKTGEEIWDGTLKQALAVALEQSPYMNIYPEERARDTMKLMNRSVDEPITRATGREICQRRNVRALLIGTRVKLERSYTVTLEATNAQSGETMALADELAQKLPEHTLNNGVWLPTIRAAIELKRNQPDKAIQWLETARQYDAAYTIHFRSAWLRAQAYLQLKQGAQAAAEFQKIIDQRGWDVTSPLWPLAHLGLARAAVLQLDMTKAKQMYDEFFRLWKDADAELPVLMEAKKDYERVK